MIEFVHMCYYLGCENEATIDGGFKGWLCEKHYNILIAAEFRWEASYLTEDDPRRKDCLEAAREWEGKNDKVQEPPEIQRDTKTDEHVPAVLVPVDQKAPGLITVKQETA